MSFYDDFNEEFDDENEELNSEYNDFDEFGTGSTIKKDSKSAKNNTNKFSFRNQSNNSSDSKLNNESKNVNSSKESHASENDNSKAKSSGDKDSSSKLGGIKDALPGFGKNKDDVKGKAKKAAKDEAKKAIKKAVKTIIKFIPFPVKIGIFIAILVLIVAAIVILIFDATSSTSQSIGNINDNFKEQLESIKAGELEGDAEQLENATNLLEKNGVLLGFTLSQLDTFYQDGINSANSDLQDAYKSKYGDLKEQNKISENDNLELYKHILRIEKYNFNKINWMQYSHNNVGGSKISDDSLKYNSDLGIEYPDDGSTDVETLMSLASPYLLNWRFPLAFTASRSYQSNLKSDLSQTIFEIKEDETNKKYNTLGDFAYEIIKHATSDITIDQYKLETCNLRSQYDVYKEENGLRDTITVRYVREYVKDEDGNIYLSETPKNVVVTGIQSATSNIDEKLADNQEINSRLNNGEVDLTKETNNEKSYTYDYTYNVSYAKAFDIIKENRYMFINYNNEDVDNKINYESESEEEPQDFAYVKPGDESKAYNAETNPIQSGATPQQIATQYGGEVQSPVQISSTPQETGENLVGKTIEYEVNILTGEYSYQKGQHHYVVRTWSDKVSPLQSKTSKLSVTDVEKYKDEMIYDTEADKQFIQNIKNNPIQSISWTADKEYYDTLEKDDSITTIDLINSNPTIIKRYLSSGQKKSTYIGYSRSDFAYSQGLENVKSLFNELAKNGSSIPFVYGSSLGFGASSGTVSMTGISLLKEYIRSWEGTPPEGSDDTKYKIFDDGTGVLTVGYGVTIRNYGEQLKALGATSLNEGDEVDKKIVDEIEESIIRSNLETVKSITSELELTEYQLHSLTSFMYNVGNINGFVEKCKQYWNPETDDQYEEQNNNANFDHGLYTNYFGKYVNGETGYLAGLEKRRKSEWTLFQTGYYDKLDKWWTPSTGNAEGIDVYNTDGSVNEEKILELQSAIEQRLNMVEAPSTLTGSYTTVGYSDRARVTGQFYGSTGGDRNSKTLQIYQCTWWANSRASEYLYNKDPEKYPNGYPTAAGDGGEYYQKNLEGGWFAYGSTPKPNSIGSGPSSSVHGHVYYVEAVDEVNGYYYISHAGGGTQWFGLQKVKIGEGPFGYQPYGFIYLDEPLK